MQEFLTRFGSQVKGVLSGFDRLVLRGSLLPLMRDHGLDIFLSRSGVLGRDFKEYARQTSLRIKEAALDESRALGRPTQYLESSRIRKEARAHELLAPHPTPEGLVCTFTALEPSMSFEYHRDADPAKRGFRRRPRHCLHVYKYFLHPRFGWLNARIQTWFPFNVQICLNGREWLARQFAAAGITDFEREDNCFPRLGDPVRAQALMDEQLTTDWPTALDEILLQLHPLHPEILAACPQNYYWTAYQMEWATDLIFESRKALAAIYPALVHHALFHFQSPDVMRFLGRKLHGCFAGEITTDFKDRPEGVRVKHWATGNSVKMYDRAGNVLRVEGTWGSVEGLKSFRPPHDEPEGKLAWRPLRKGTADLHRRAELGQGANDRYLDALAAVDAERPLGDIFDTYSKPTTYRGRRVRALRLNDRDDLALLLAISRGEFKLTGFRNRDLRGLLYPTKRHADPGEIRRLSGRVSRLLRLLRAHGVIRKIQKSHRYQLTEKGTLLTAALFAARHATPKQLLRDAA